MPTSVEKAFTEVIAIALGVSLENQEGEAKAKAYVAEMKK